MEIRNRLRLHAFASLVLRLAVGLVFVAHGSRKLLGVGGGGGPTATAAFFAGVGLTPAYPLVLFVGIVEVVGGLLLGAGAFTLPAALALTFVMAVAVWKVHFANGFFLNWTNAPGLGHGYEFNLVLLAALVSLMLTGPGALSVDARRVRPPETEPADPPRLRAGSV